MESKGFVAHEKEPESVEVSVNASGTTTKTVVATETSTCHPRRWSRYSSKSLPVTGGRQANTALTCLAEDVRTAIPEGGCDPLDRRVGHDQTPLRLGHAQVLHEAHRRGPHHLPEMAGGRLCAQPGVPRHVIECDPLV